MLSLPEEYALLTLNDAGDNRAVGSGGTTYGIAGAALMDLLRLGRIKLDAGGVVLRDASLTGDGFLDRVLEDIRTARHTNSTRDWVVSSLRISRMREAVLAGLVEKRVLVRIDTTVLWVFPHRAYPAVDLATKQTALNRFRSAAMGIDSPDDRMLDVLALAHATRLFSALFSRDERREVDARFASILRNDPGFGGPVAAAVREAVSAADSAANDIAISAATSGVV